MSNFYYCPYCTRNNKYSSFEECYVCESSFDSPTDYYDHYFKTNNLINPTEFSLSLSIYSKYGTIGRYFKVSKVNDINMLLIICNDFDVRIEVPIKTPLTASNIKEQLLESVNRFKKIEAFT